MLVLHHQVLNSASRFVRLILAEYGEEPELREEQPWERRREFLALNPAGTVPVMISEAGAPVVGFTAIAEYLDETRGVLKRDRRLLPEYPLERAEVRRLVDWFLIKMEAEVTRPLVRERVLKGQMPAGQGGGSPDAAALRAARSNVRQHMKYVGWLAGSRNWLAGGRLSYGDLAAGAAISALDYLGEVDWTLEPAAREWFVRLKSRPCFRALLSDRVRGLTPSSHYADLDF